MFWKSHGIEKRDLLVPASILVGAILVSLSICLSVLKISSGSYFAKTDSEKVVPTDDVAIIKVTERKDAPKEGKGKVKIVEFADFQCPFCKSFYDQSYKQIKSEYIDTGKVVFEFRHFPLSFHQNAQISGEAAECANRQGKFFEYHDLLFMKGKGDGTGLDAVSLKNYALQVELDTAKFNKCLDGGETKEIVKADFDAGSKVGVTGTPTFFVNGKRFVGAQPFQVFKQAIDEALK